MQDCFLLLFLYTEEVEAFVLASAQTDTNSPSVAEQDLKRSNLQVAIFFGMKDESCWQSVTIPLMSGCCQPSRMAHRLAMPATHVLKCMA
jgi:hypothetical protein